MNVYINDIRTNIIKRRYIDGKTHLVANENIVLDYEKYNIEKENIIVNGHPVEEIYDSSIGHVFVVAFKPNDDRLRIRVDYDKRIRILESLTLRPVIKSSLNKYMNLQAINFFTSSEDSYFDIEGVYLDEDAQEIVNILNKNINEYLLYNLDIRNDKTEDKSYIEDLFEDKYCPYMLNSLSEIKKFKISKYVFTDRAIRLHYSTR